MEEIPLCANCKRVNREASDFIGDDGKQKKTCKKCRNKGKRRVRSQEQIDKKNENQREKKYYQRYRDKKRSENEGEYLKNNAENAKKWRDSNKEHLSKYRSNDINQRTYDIKRNSIRRDIYWDSSMTEEVCENMICLECHYCGYLSLDKLNGIDRIDNTRGYIVDNCVSCCSICNRMKGSLDYVTYINRCKHISFNFTQDGEIHEEAWPDCKSITYKGYKKRAIKKGIEFDIPEEYYKNVMNDRCYYCKIDSETGLDRVYNETGYIMQNIVSCCSECNYMKFDMKLDDFIEHCSKISEYALGFDLEARSDICLRSIKRRQVKQGEPSKKTYDMKTLVSRNSIKKEVTPKEKKPVPKTIKESKNIQTIQPVETKKFVKQKPTEKTILILEKLDNEKLIELMTKKGVLKTQEASDEIREKYNIIIQRSQISKLWNGEILPNQVVIDSEEYKKALSLDIKRKLTNEKTEKWKASMKEGNSKKRKITDEQMVEIMNQKKTAYSSKELAEKYNVSRTVVDNIWLGRILPIDESIVTEEYKELILHKRTRMKKSII